MKTTENIFTLANRQLQPVFASLRQAIESAKTKAEENKFKKIYQKFVDSMHSFEVVKK